jgi:hypothetical protein
MKYQERVYHHINQQPGPVYEYTSRSGSGSPYLPAKVGSEDLIWIVCLYLDRLFLLHSGFFMPQGFRILQVPAA